MNRIRPLAALLAALIVPACGGGASGVALKTRRASLPTSGAQSTGASRTPSLSADGRFIAFESVSSDLVAGDTNGFSDVFVHDARTGVTTRVSVDSAGAEGNGASYFADISGDGNFVAFSSEATNLVAGDSNGVLDVFVHDRQTGVTTRISVDSSGTQGDAVSDHIHLSSTGRYAVFQSDATNLVAGDANANTDVFLRDRQMGTTIRVSVDSSGAEANGGSGNPRISSSGEAVAFESGATNLVAGDTNGVLDVFFHEMAFGTTIRASVTSAGAQATLSSFMGALSSNGRYVVFNSVATDLVAGDTNGSSDVFVFDTEIGTTVRVSLTSAGAQANSDSGVRSISDSGRFVVFDSEATNLFPGDSNGDTDVFLRDTVLGTTTLISMGIGGGAGNGYSGSAVISGDGRYIAFSSEATDLVAGDTNGQEDVFLRGPLD